MFAAHPINTAWVYDLKLPRWLRLRQVCPTPRCIAPHHFVVKSPRRSGRRRRYGLYEIASYMASTADEIVVHRWDASGNTVTLHAHADDSINDGAAGGNLVVPANSTVRLKPVIDFDNVGHRWISA